VTASDALAEIALASRHRAVAQLAVAALADEALLCRIAGSHSVPPTRSSPRPRRSR
jgi:hypothetical protein